jgi:hypothetical protein
MQNDIGLGIPHRGMKTSRIPREQNPYFLSGHGKKKVWFFFWTTAASKNSR